MDMSEAQSQQDVQGEKVAVTVQIDPQAYAVFSRKAEKAGVDVETFLSKTLITVLGCRAFDTTIACSPQFAAAQGSKEESGKSV